LVLLLVLLPESLPLDGGEDRHRVVVAEIAKQ